MKDAIQLTIGTYTQGSDPARGIVRAVLAADGSSIAALGAVTPFADPSWVVRSPDGRRVYAVSEGAEGEVAAFATAAGRGADAGAGEVADAGAEPAPLTPLSLHATRGAEPCHASLIGGGTHLAVANYGTGSLSVHPIGPDGEVGAQSQLVQHAGVGPDGGRQAGPHAHMVTEDPAGRYVLAVDLGADSIFGYELDAQAGKLTRVAQSRFRPGFGPRHLAFHPGGELAYVIGELGFAVATCRYDAARGELSVLGEVPVLEDGVPGEDFPSGIRIAPDGRHLYTANRGRDTLCVFSLVADAAKPELVATVRTGAAWPRDIALAPDGTLLLSANEHGGCITVFRLDPETGIPHPTGARLDVPAPTCLVMAQ
ncbi:MAG TPA: lactonase family protein [Actinospica sp.]|nr:lactonase family protein [Actinospica sp.]